MALTPPGTKPNLLQHRLRRVTYRNFPHRQLQAQAPRCTSLSPSSNTRYRRRNVAGGHRQNATPTKAMPTPTATALTFPTLIPLCHAAVGCCAAARTRVPKPIRINAAHERRPFGQYPVRAERNLIVTGTRSPFPVTDPTLRRQRLSPRARAPMSTQTRRR